MAVSTIIMAILFVVVVVLITLFLTRGTSNANVSSLLPCNPFGGEGCEQAGARTVEATGFVEDAIRCAYMRCFKGCNDPDINFIGTNGWCKKYFCSDPTKMDKTDNKGRICDENAEAYPVQPSKTAKGAKLQSKTLKLPNPTNTNVDVCIISKNSGNCKFEDFVYETSLKANKGLYEKNVVLEIPPEYLVNSRGTTCYLGEATVDVDKISIWAVHASKNTIRDNTYTDTHERLVSLRICKSVQGPVTLFKDEKFGVPFLDISDKRADLGDLNNKVSSVKLESNWGVTLYDNKEYKGDCRTFFSSVEKLKDFGFGGSAESVNVWKDGFKGAILYSDKDLKENKNNEYFPNDGTKYNLKDTDCVFKNVKSVKISTDSVVVFYDENGILFKTSGPTPTPSNSGNIPDKQDDFTKKITSIKVCPKDSGTCLTDEEKALLG